MKSFALFLLLTAACLAQGSITGGYGLRFGASMEDAAQFAKSEGWKQLQSGAESHLAFRLATDSALTRFDLRFEQGRLSWILARTRGATPRHTMDLYRRTVAGLTQELGFEPESKRAFASDSARDDERDMADIRTGTSEISDDWQAPAALPDVMSSVHAEISRMGEITVWFLEQGMEVKRLEESIKLGARKDAGGK
jgi:hypothetical protein